MNKPEKSAHHQKNENQKRTQAKMNNPQFILAHLGLFLELFDPFHEEHFLSLVFLPSLFAHVDVGLTHQRHHRSAQLRPRVGALGLGCGGRDNNPPSKK